MSSSPPEPRHTQTQQQRRRRRLPAPPAVTPAACGGNADADAGALPTDALCEILLRLPGRQLCRLRTVCRAWRCLLCAPWFAPAHAARRREPYVVASYADRADLDRDGLVDVLDMSSGQIVRQVAAGDASDVVVGAAAAASGSAGLVCVVKTVETGGFRLLDPVTGAVRHLPGGELAPEHAARGFSLRDYGEPVHMFAGTGEHIKVLRMLPYRPRRGTDGGGGRDDDLFEVCTLGSSSSSARWRGIAQGPPRPFVWNEWTRVVVGGVVYCLSVAAYLATVVNRRADDDERGGWIVRFDLEAEEWRPSIKGPSGLLLVDGRRRNNNSYPKQVTLASLNGSLVIVHGSTRIMDLWFLVDSGEEGVWVKQYSVQTARSGHLSPMHPLLVLEDGRIVTVIKAMQLLQIYDPRTGTFASLMMLRHSSRVSVHTGSFLSLHGLRLAH